MDRLTFAVQLLRDERFDDAFEVLLFPSYGPEYATTRELVKGLVLYQDVLHEADGKPPLLGSADTALRTGLDALDAALAAVPDDDILGYNRALLARFAVIKGVDLGVGSDIAWSRTEDYFRRSYANGTPESRAQWLQTLRVRYAILKQDAALEEALPILHSTESAEILGYEEDTFDGTVLLLVAAGDYARAYELLRDYGVPESSKTGGPMHAVLVCYLGSLIVEHRQPENLAAVEAVLARPELEFTDLDLRASRYWIDKMRAKLQEEPASER